MKEAIELGQLAVGVIGIVAGVLVLYRNSRVAFSNQRADAILSCASRYDDIYKVKENLIITKSESVLESTYFSRYWGLESDQIDFWYASYIDPETMAKWLMSTANNLKSSSVGDISYRAGWKEHSQYHNSVNQTLYEFCEQTLGLGDDIYKNPAKLYAFCLLFLSRMEKSKGTKFFKRVSYAAVFRTKVDSIFPWLPHDVQQAIHEQGRHRDRVPIN